MKKTASRFLAVVLALCLAVSVMPSALARAEVAKPDPQDFDLKLELQYTGNGKYQARYTATLKVSNQFAEAVAVYHDKDNVLNDLVFTCLLQSNLIDEITDEALNFYFTSPGEVFIPNEGYDKGEGNVLTAQLVTEGDTKTVKAEFTLNPGKDEDWKTASAETIKEELQAPVTVISDWLPVTSAQIKNAMSENNTIHSDGRVDISRKSGRGVPLYGEATVEGAATAVDVAEVSMGELTLDITRDPDAVGEVNTVEVTLTDGDGESKTYTAEKQSDGDNHWSCTIPGLPYGTYSVTVTATLADGTTVQCEKDCTVDGPEVTVEVVLPATYLSTEVTGDVKPAVDNLENAIPISEAEEDIVPPSEADENHITVVDIELSANALTADSVIQDEDMGNISAEEVMDSINEAGLGYDLHGNGFVDFVDVVITKHVEELEKREDGSWQETQKEDTPVHDTAGLITMRFPISADLRRALAAADAAREEGEPEVTNANILVFRRHGSDIQAMRKVSEAVGSGANYECYYISTVGGEGGSGAEYITIKANQFSVYAFGVSMMPVGEYSPATYYYVTFETNGGSGIYRRGVIRGGTLNLERILPQREGYIFTGWYTDPELTNRVTRVIVRGNMKLYAGWHKRTADPDETGVAKLLNTDDHYDYIHGFPSGVFLPDAPVARKEVAQMFYNLLRDKTPTAPAFTDVPADEWYADAVGTLAELGVFRGVGNDKFDPDRSITRAEFTAAAMRFASLNPGGENIFTDVEEGRWYYGEILGAVTYGWIEGRAEGIFDPDGFLTRAEAVTIINRMLCRYSDRSYIASHVEDLVTFPDAPTTHWAYYDIEEAANAHNYSGDLGETWSE